MINNKIYDALKTTALIAAPVIVFASTLLNIWSVPYADQITASLAAVDVLLGATVTALKSSYDKTDTGDK